MQGVVSGRHLVTAGKKQISTLFINLLNYLQKTHVQQCFCSSKSKLNQFILVQIKEILKLFEKYVYVV